MRREIRLVNPDGSVRTYDATGRDIHIDVPLSEILINYQQVGAVAEALFPIVNVTKQSDVYYTFAQADLWRIPDTVRAPLTAPKMVDFNVASETYFARNFSLATGISIEDRANADEVLQLRQTKAMFVRDLLMLDTEQRLASAVVNSSAVSTFTAPLSGAWGNHAASDPIFDIDNSIETMRAATGFRPTDLLLGPLAWRHLKRNSTLRQLIYPTPGGTAGPGLISTTQVANVFDLRRVHVGELVQNTAAEGLPKNLADIWGPHAILFFRPDRPSRESPSFAYSFRWSPPGAPSMQVSEFFDPRIKGGILDVSVYEDHKIVASDLATVIASVV